MARLAPDRLWLASLLALVCTASAAAQTTARFGQSASSADVNGDGFSDVIVGEPGHDGSAVDEGRVLVFHGSSTGPASVPSWSRSGLQAGAHLGAAVAGLGDVNGDGFDDVAVGAPDFDAPRPNRLVGPGAAQLVTYRGSGALLVFLGSSAGLQSVPALVRTGSEHREHLGASLARAGDVNGDGFDDVLVGASGTGAGVGAAFVFLGSAAGPGPLPHWVGQPPLLQANTGYGRVLAGGGDVNGDGFDDVVVGLPDGGVAGRGTALAYHGSSAGLPAAPSWTLPTPPSGDGPLDNGNNDWGTALSLGDANGNGFDDLVISDPYFDGDLGHGSGQYLDTGVVFVLAGSSSGLGSMARRNTGYAGNVASVGDVTGDGRAESVLIYPGDFIQIVRYGSASYFGGLSYIGGELSDYPGAGFGTSISPGGDIDDDGRLDLLIGDPLVDLDTADEGAVYVYRGVAGGELSGNSDWVLTAP